MGTSVVYKHSHDAALVVPRERGGGEGGGVECHVQEFCFLLLHQISWFVPNNRCNFLGLNDGDTYSSRANRWIRDCLQYGNPDDVELSSI